MLPCFTSGLPQNQTESHGAISRDNAVANTPRSFATTSSSLNLSHEFGKVVRTASYNEILSKIQAMQDWDTLDVNQQQQFLAQLLEPNNELTQETLQRPNSNPFTQHLLTYFHHTEQICHLLLNLNQGVHHAQSLYFPIQELFDVLPGDSDSLTQAQCNRAYDIFLGFQDRENPFLCSESNKFCDMQHCFSELKEQVDGSLHRSQTRVRVVRWAITGSAIFFIGTIVAVVTAAVSIGVHALVALLAGCFCPSILPKLVKKDLDHIERLNDTARGAYVLQHHLQTVDRLVSRLQAAVDDDKSLICLGLSRGRERHPMSEVVKRVEKNHGNVKLHLADLEKHICVCLTAINRVRSLLLHLHQSFLS